MLPADGRNLPDPGTGVSLECMTGHIEDGRAATPGQAEGTGLPDAGMRAGGRAGTLLAVGTPGSGKTEFALGELIRGLRELAIQTQNKY